jgi:hypothetical protein
MNKRKENRSNVGVSCFFKPYIGNISSWEKEENLAAVKTELLSALELMSSPVLLLRRPTLRQ